jgi:hypothetical protein
MFEANPHVLDIDYRGYRCSCHHICRLPFGPQLHHALPYLTSILHQVNEHVDLNKPNYKVRAPTRN